MTSSSQGLLLPGEQKPGFVWSKLFPACLILSLGSRAPSARLHLRRFWLLQEFAEACNQLCEAIECTAE